MKATLEFNDDEQEELKDALRGTEYCIALNAIWEQCFRPMQKHGYTDEYLNSEEAYEVIEKLSKKYLEIVEDLDIF